MGNGRAADPLDPLDLLEARLPELELLAADDVFDPVVDALPGGAGAVPGPQGRWSDCLPGGLLGDLLMHRGAVAGPARGWESLERAGAWERIVAWAQARQAREVVGFVEHAERRPVGGQRPHEAMESAVAEVGLMLGLTSRAANARVSEALTLCARLPATLGALERGEISAAGARAIAEQTCHLSDDEAGRVEASVLAKAAGRRTAPQIREATRRVVHKTDPEAVRRRHRQQRRERGVRVYDEPDGMATLSLFGTAPDVMGAYAVVDEHARRAGPGGQEASMDARRADALVDLLLHGPVTGPNLTPHTGVTSGSAADTHPVVDNRGGRPDSAGTPGPRAWARPQAGRPLVGVTVSLSTLLGLDQRPGELAGYGPIPAEVAREIAADATWRRIVTDPVSGAVLDYGTTRYTPPASLAAHVTTRDQTCRFPGCRVPADRCDLDHGVAFDAGGPTSAANLSAKCRRHHRLKHQPGWEVTQARDGTLTWTTPSGHVYSTTAPPQPRHSPQAERAREAGLASESSSTRPPAQGTDRSNLPPF